MKKIFLKIISLFWLFSIPYICWGQLNESDSLQYQIRLAASGNLQKGNVDLFRLIHQAEGYTQIGNFVFKSENLFLFQKIFGNKVDVDALSKNYLYYRPTAVIYPYWIGYASTNFRRRIRHRYFTGLGLTNQLIQRKNNNLKLSANILYESTKHKGVIYNREVFNGQENINNWSSTLYLKGFHHLKNSLTTVFYELYWQQSLERQKNFRYYLSMGINLKITRSFSLRTRMTYTYEHIVVTSIKQHDFMWNWGLSYNLSRLAKLIH